MRKLFTLMLSVILTACLTLSCASAQESWMPEWDMDADVVVVGFGPAGAMAAKSAMENGASVLVVEKASKEFAGGSAPTSMGFIKPYSPEEIFSRGSGRLTMETAQLISDKANELLGWMGEQGLELQGSTAVGYGMGFYKVLVKGMEALGTKPANENQALNAKN